MKNNLDNSQVETAYNTIKGFIISYIYYPGSPISDSKIAKNLEISRAPVREAIVRLQMEGLIATNEQGKLVVSSITLDDIIDILTVRKALETEAIRLISQHGWLNETQEKHLQDIFNEQKKAYTSVKAADIYQYDDLFHSTIVQYSQSPRIQSILDNMRLQMQRARWLNVAIPDRETDVITEHENIINGILRHDLDGTISFVSTHFSKGIESFSNLLHDDNFRTVASAIKNFYSFTNE